MLEEVEARREAGGASCTLYGLEWPLMAGSFTFDGDSN
jgi:hypothetical protein